MEKQVKSKERVAEHGEVYTAEREVKAMCDLVKEQCNDIDATFLEPACGNGNFLSEILSRKLIQVNKNAKNNCIEWEWLSVRAVSTLGGVISGAKLGISLRSHYLKFPQTPDGFDKWVEKSDKLWQKVGRVE